MRTRAKAADSVAPSLDYLSTAFDVPEADLQILLDSPTTELVNDFLQSLTDKGREHDDLKAQKLKLDVELDNTVRTTDAKLKAQKSTLAKHAQESSDLQAKLDEAVSAREKLTSEVDQLRSSSSGSSAETQSLRQRIETLEASNRDALVLVESKSTEKDRIANELSEQHAKLLGVRREVSELEERNQTLLNAASSQKFKEQSLQQEIDLLKKNNEYYTNELQTRSQEHAKFRKERNARIASLQRELEDSTATVETLQRTETTLRQRLDEVQAKADEAFARIASLEEDAARKEQAWKAELDGSKRLAELQAQNAATHRARLQEVQGQVDKIHQDAAEEIGRLQSEVETERTDKNQAESKLAGLELQIQRLEQQPRASRPGTPMNNGGFDPATPGRAGSPFSFSASARKFGNKLPFSNTEYWAKYNEMQQDLEAERRRTQKLSTAVDEMVTELENRAPEYIEIRRAHNELEQQVLDFSRLLEEAHGTRDNAMKEVERWQSEAEARAREGEILRQQLRDLAAQVKILTVEVQCRDQGLDGMSADEKYKLELMARGELEDFQSQNESFTDQFISQKLVIFHDVAQLQEKNQQMRQMLRDFGEKMEGEEARKKAAESAANAQEVEDLRGQIERYKDELQATATQIDSYVKERDMFRRMLQRRGDLPGPADMQSAFGQSIPPATPQRNGADGVPQTPRSKDVEDLNKLLKEQQTFFDQYRHETASDRKLLKEQVDGLGREKSSLQSELAHWKSQKALADERLQMFQANLNGLRSENTELQRRSQQMAESAAKQDLRTQQVAEELVEARSMADSLRNENSNVKAEKDLWKRIEARLTDDNKGLMDERSRLNKLVTDLQNLQNERELTDSDSRRRLQGRVDSLEAELAESKKKLGQEVEDARQATLRREYQDGQSRTRIDDLVKSLGNVREELVAAKTIRDQLQARVDEMKIELRSAEERVAALQPRPTPRAEPQQNGQHEDEEDVPAEQRLALEVSDLRRDLDFARNELEGARQQVEQYKAIAQGTEEELANFNETSDQFKDEMDRQIAEKDARVNELQQRVDDLLIELTTTNNELSELRTKHDDSDRTLNEQKAGFESEIARLTNNAERYAEEKKLYQEDLKAQAEIAQQAQQSYDDELVKHAEAAKNLKSVRDEHNTLRTQVAGIRAEAEAAKASLERGEESWTEQREKFEQELEQAKTRRADVDTQNQLLHTQMDQFSTELAALRSGRAVAANDGEERSSTPAGDGNNMQEVVKYLRREKEIVDVQYELSMQESKRLQQQLDYATRQLEDTKQRLTEERRQAADKTASEGSTTKLTQTINELNLFRESSTTLRNEARQAREKLEEKSKDVERLLAELDPLKERVGELEGELEVHEGNKKLLEDDRDHWRERTQNIISKYDRVDPAELEDMKKQLEELKAEKARLEDEQAPLREQVDGLEAKIQQSVQESTQPFKDRLEAFRNQAKEQNRKQNEKIKDAQLAIDTANSEKTKATEELESVRTELQQAQTALQEAQNKAPATSGDNTAAGGIDETQQAWQTRATQADAKVAEQTTRAEALANEVSKLEARVAELEGQLATMQDQLDQALQNEEGEINDDAETLEKVKQDLAAAQEEVNTLKADTTTAIQPTNNAQPAEGEKSLADQVAEEVAKLRTELEQQHELAKNQLQEEHDRRIEGHKTSLRNKLSQEKEKIREEVRQELVETHSAELQKMRDEHEATISKLRSDHHAEIERLSKDGAAAVANAGGDALVVKSESASSSVEELPSEAQILELMKTNPRVKGILNSNINKRVALETERHHKIVAEKDEEIAKLKLTQGTESTDEGKEDLQKKIDAAENEKKEAVRLALEQAEKKTKVQLSMLSMIQAKVGVVRKAVQETPEKPVKEVWDVADKAKPPPPKPPGATPSASSPAQKPVMPSSPVVATPSTDALAPSSPTQNLTEEQRVLQRQQRFGTGPPTAASGTFGQPSLPISTGALTQPARRPSMSTNQIPGPMALAPSGTAPAALRGALGSRGAGGIPRGASTAARGSGIHIQGAAAQQGSARGGASTGIPRGGGAPSSIARGGRGGMQQRGGSNAGQKRPHDGGEGGDGKRMRGGAPSGS